MGNFFSSPAHDKLSVNMNWLRNTTREDKRKQQLFHRSKTNDAHLMLSFTATNSTNLSFLSWKY